MQALLERAMIVSVVWLIGNFLYFGNDLLVDVVAYLTRKRLEGRRWLIIRHDCGFESCWSHRSVFKLSSPSENEVTVPIDDT